jgi:hypothetical protein
MIPIPVNNPIFYSTKLPLHFEIPDFYLASNFLMKNTFLKGGGGEGW